MYKMELMRYHLSERGKREEERNRNVPIGDKKEKLDTKESNEAEFDQENVVDPQ